MLNTFDGVVLILIVSVSVLPVFEGSNAVVVTFVLLIIPLILCVAIVLLACKHHIKRIAKNCCNTAPNNTNISNVSSDRNEIPMTTYGIIVDDKIRRNATICGM